MSSQNKKILNLKAELKSNDLVYAGIIENLTDKDLYVRTVAVEPCAELKPGKSLEVKFCPSEGEPIHLNGIVKWSYKTPPYGITDSIGVEITEPHLKYEDFLKTLQ